jgi:hypothetical protein
MPNSPIVNRNEFLEEAVGLASTGVVSLLIEPPCSRPGFRPDPDRLALKALTLKCNGSLFFDLRRGLDLFRPLRRRPGTYCLCWAQF